MREAEVQQQAAALLARFGGVTEQYPTIFGPADIVTDTTVWEVKKEIQTLSAAAAAASQADRYNRVVGRPHIGIVFPSVKEALDTFHAEELFLAYPGLRLLDPLTTAVFTYKKGSVVVEALDNDAYTEGAWAAHTKRVRAKLIGVVAYSRSVLRENPSAELLKTIAEITFPKSQALQMGQMASELVEKAKTEYEEAVRNSYESVYVGPTLAQLERIEDIANQTDLLNRLDQAGLLELAEGATDRSQFTDQLIEELKE